MSALAEDRAWHNPSVLALAAGRDPLEAAADVANELLSEARSAGMDGPPVDVLGLAKELGMTLRPAAEGWDASLSVREGAHPAATATLRERAADFIIDYDPSRPRGRLRFSIAHEIAHACFADVGEKTRHRSAQGAVSSEGSSDWELELLCNVIASELLLPTEAIEGLLDIDLDIDFVMETRKRWDTSTEALLRRLTAESHRPLSMLALSKTSDTAASEFRVDYSQMSSSASPALASIQHGDRVDGNEILRRLVAVGQTVKGEMVLGGAPALVQAVGIPAYPGSVYPRVLALVEPKLPSLPRTNIAYVTGDVLDWPEDGAVIVAHVVSDSVRSWSRTGAAGALGRAFPDIAGAFRAWSIADRVNLSLGNVHSIGRNMGGRYVEVASLVAQHGYGDGPPRLRYDALAQALEVVAERAARKNATVHVPRLGAGRAGGRWDLIEEALAVSLAERGIQVVVHTLPSQAVGRTASAR